jgi:hypothetical protein
MNTGDQVRIDRTGETGEIVEVFGRQIWVRVYGRTFDPALPHDGDAHYGPLNRWWFEAGELTVIADPPRDAGARSSANVTRRG